MRACAFGCRKRTIVRFRFNKNILFDIMIIINIINNINL
nr:MAG TPA: hypothetical protein [Caudoviricetes sp.]